MKSNEELREIYDRVFATGAEHFFSKYKNGKDESETHSVVIGALGKIEGKTILDVGCGTGELAASLAELGAARVTGIDYSEKAISTARERYSQGNLEFLCRDIADWQEPVDVLVSCGTFEHMDDPQETLKKFASLIGFDGQIVLTCPHFYNIRGFIWITLQKLLDVPMSLTDLHSISPADMRRWADSAGLSVELFETFDDDRGNGPALIVDLEKRLTNALRDAKLPNHKVESFLAWLGDLLQYRESWPDALKLEGSNGLHKLVPIRTG